MFKRKKQEIQQPQAPVYQQPAGVSMSIPMDKLIRVRKRWLTGMFLLGMFSQYLLALYVPIIWNFVYGVLQKLLPAF